MVDAHVYVYYTSGCTLLLGGESWCVVSYHCGSLRCSLKVQGNAKASELGMSNSQTPTLFFVPIYLCYLQKTIASGRSAIGDKYMKKILLLAVASFALLFASCGSNNGPFKPTGDPEKDGKAFAERVCSKIKSANSKEDVESVIEDLKSFNHQKWEWEGFDSDYYQRVDEVVSREMQNSGLEEDIFEKKCKEFHVEPR